MRPGKAAAASHSIAMLSGPPDTASASGSPGPSGRPSAAIRSSWNRVAGSDRMPPSLDARGGARGYLHFAVVRPRLISASIAADSLPA